MKNIMFVLLIMIIAPHISAQDVDMNKMRKDLEVAEQVLSSVLEKNGSNRFYLRHSKVLKARYLGAYGVVITFQPDITYNFVGAAANIVSARKSGAEVGQSFPHAGSLGERVDIPHNKAIQLLNHGRNNLKTINVDTAILEYLADYGGLIRQLNPDQKIMVKSARNKLLTSVYSAQAVFNVNALDNKRSENKSIEVKIADIQELESGKIDKWEFYKRAEIKELSKSTQGHKESEIFASIFARLYQSDLSRTYYIANQPIYEYIPKAGVSFNMKFYSSKSFNGGFFLPTIDMKLESKQERNQVVEDMYDDFKSEFITNVLDYGHLLKSLESNEEISFYLEMTECEGCTMPANLEVTLTKEVIDDFRDGMISKEAATKKIYIKEY